MISKSLWLPALGLFLLAAPASAMASADDDCTVLDQLLHQARTEFPTLANRQLGGAVCKYRKNEFTCTWRVATDRYGEAQTQIERLERCTAAQPHAALLERKHGKATFQIDDVTKVLVQGPLPADGDWGIQLKITTNDD